MAAVAPAQLERAMDDVAYDAAGSDVDAEGEDDPEVYYDVSRGVVEELSEDAEGSDIEPIAEEPENDEEDDDEEHGVGAVKIPKGETLDSDEDAVIDISETSIDVDDEPNKSSSEAESANGAEWEGDSEGGEEAEGEVANRNNCVFCGQDEENDPCEEFEEYMACAVCGDNSHRQCARDAKSLTTDDDTEKWRCPDCVVNSLEPDNTEEAVSRRRSSASKFTRDLLPAQRGASRPGSHSVFNNLILDDDPLDGSRSLRKRKASSDEVDAQSKTSSRRRKRLRSLSSGSEDSRSPLPSLSAEHNQEDRVEEIVEDVIAVENGKVEIAEVAPKEQKASRPARPRRPKKEPKKGNSLRIVRQNSESLVVAFALNVPKVKDSEPKKKRRRPPAAVATTTPHPRFATSNSSHYATPFYSFHERENDELKSKPYGGILPETDADTSKTLPLAADRARFEDARQKAEDEWKLKTATAEAEGETKGRVSQK
ncbi:MAG: hypothetical protein Q9187_007225, partial [Circinaria calcarea]